MWNERNVLLFAHVVGAIVLLGPTTMATSSFGRHVRNGDLGAAASAHRTSRSYGTASIVVPALGVVLAQRIDVFGDLWVQLAIVLFVVGGLLLAAVHLPAQRQALGRMRDGNAIDAGLAGRLQSSAGGYALTWVIIVWLMIAKPV
jgi:uncharacterized membrane protein